MFNSKELDKLSQQVRSLMEDNKRLYTLVTELSKGMTVQNEINDEVYKRHWELRKLIDEVNIFANSIDTAVMVMKSYMEEDGMIPDQQDFLMRLSAAGKALAKWKVTIEGLEKSWNAPSLEFGEDKPKKDKKGKDK